LMNISIQWCHSFHSFLQDKYTSLSL
jgi:hypothetical protein